MKIPRNIVEYTITNSNTKNIPPYYYGIETRSGYIRKWISYNQFETRETKVPPEYSLTDFDDKEYKKDVWKFMKKYICGDLRVLTPPKKSYIKKTDKVYLINRYEAKDTLLVLIRKNKVEIYKISKNTYIPSFRFEQERGKTLNRDEYFHNHLYLFREKIASFSSKKIFFPKIILKNENTARVFNENHHKYRGLYNNYCFLLQIGAREHEYVYIGEMIYKFRAKEQIREFKCMYNSFHNFMDQHDAFAIDSANDYYLLDDIVKMKINAELNNSVEKYKIAGEIIPLHIYLDEDESVRSKIRMESIKHKMLYIDPVYKKVVYQDMKKQRNEMICAQK
jgi:hypothetical protein